MFKSSIKRFFAFTIAEVMLTTVILSAVIAISIPIAVGTRPSTEKVMLKKAYNLTENVIADLLSNPLYYPQDITLAIVNSTNFPGNTSSAHLLNHNYPDMNNILISILQDISSTGKVANRACAGLGSQHNKLSMLFMCSFKSVVDRGGCYYEGDTKTTYNTGCMTTSGSTTCHFTTNDGIHWKTVDVSESAPSITTPIFTISVFIGGKKGGCYKAMNITNNKLRQHKFDFYVYYNGKVLPDSAAQNVLSNAYSNKVLNY